MTDAQWVLEQALQVARSIWDAGDRSLALSSVAEAMAKAGMWEQALQVAKSIEDALFRSSALVSIALAMLEKEGKGR
ncbi:MAG: hypothetical protein C4295_12530 [Candidatus Fervidibacterota bacterium]